MARRETVYRTGLLACALRWAQLVTLLVLAIPPQGKATSMDTNATPFRFEDYRNLSDEHAQNEASAKLNAKFPRGSNTTDFLQEMGTAGAKCKELPKYPEFYYCTYDHASGGLFGMLIRVEWKVIAFHDVTRKIIEKIDVYRGSTGL